MLFAIYYVPLPFFSFSFFIININDYNDYCNHYYIEKSKKSRTNGKKKDRLDADLWTGTFAHTGLKSNVSNIHLLINKSGWGYSSK